MKIEINLDDKFFEEKFKEYRSASFSNTLQILGREVTARSKLKQPRYPSWILDSKIVTHEFAKILNVKCPQITQVECTIDEINFTKNSVLKPIHESSATGVYIYDDKSMYYLNNNLSFDNIDDLKKHAKSLMAQGHVRRDRWMVEELIGDSNNIARDVKFYMFYGEVGLILESDRLPSLKRCWYDDSYKIVDTGKYKNRLFKGNPQGLEKFAELAKSISVELPVPFVRLDFLQVGDDIYLGEFTPRPGSFTAFNNDWDIKLGDMYQSSVVRLIADVGNGKVFEKYNSLNKIEKDIIKQMKEQGSQA